MASQTSTLHLVKPGYSETVDVGTLNNNMDLIDTGVGASVKNITRSGTTYTVTRTNGTTFTFDQQDTSYPTAITNITRNGTTFTATRANGTTFTFTQQDNNTTYSQISRGSGAGLAPGLPGGNGTTKYLREDGSWQVPPNTTYSLPLAANGTRGGVQIGYTQSGKNYPVQLSGEKMYVNVPWTDTNTDTNTWRGIQNNLTSTSTTDSLSAAQGKVLNDKIDNAIGTVSSPSVAVVLKSTNSSYGGVGLISQAGYKLILQNDGNLVIYNKSNTAVWTSNTREE